jgi:hypothetical protein
MLGLQRYLVAGVPLAAGYTVTACQACSSGQRASPTAVPYLRKGRLCARAGVKVDQNHGQCEARKCRKRQCSKDAMDKVGEPQAFHRWVEDVNSLHALWVEEICAAV